MNNQRQGRPKTREHELTKAEKESALSIFNTTDENSVFNMITEPLQEKLLCIPKVYLTWSEKALEKNADLDPRDHRLRIALWNAHNLAVERGHKTISVRQIINGICTHRYFYDQVATNHKKLAWIFFPPTDYTKFMQECLYQGMQKMREVLVEPIRDKKGNLNHKLIDQQIRIFEKVENRVKGVTPKALNINQKSVNLNVNKNQDLGPAPSVDDLHSIEEEIRLLEGGAPEENPLVLGEKTTKLQEIEGSLLENNINLEEV